MYQNVKDRGQQLGENNSEDNDGAFLRNPVIINSLDGKEENIWKNRDINNSKLKINLEHCVKRLIFNLYHL